jgi:hypothetical protein
MTEGRPLHGEGAENIQDYVNERLNYASSNDDLAAANRTLEQELADLEALRGEQGRHDARTNIDALIKEAELRVERMQFRPGSEQLEVGSGSQVDFDQLPPDAEARQNVSNRLDDNAR